MLQIIFEQKFNSFKYYVRKIILFKTHLDITFSYLFFKETYYLNTEANLTQFSERMGMTSDKMVEYVHGKYGMSFENLCDHHRTQNFIKKMTHPMSLNLPVGALLKGCGFSSTESLHNFLKLKNSKMGS